MEYHRSNYRNNHPSGDSTYQGHADRSGDPVAAPHRHREDADLARSGTRPTPLHWLTPSPPGNRAPPRESFVPVPKPSSYKDLVALKAPVFVNRRADPKVVIRELMRIAARHPQALDNRFVYGHIPSDRVTFLCIKDFYGEGAHVAGFYTEYGDNNESEGSLEWGDGCAEMFFTVCNDKDLDSDVMVYQIGELDDTRGGGLAERVKAGSKEAGGKGWEHERLYMVVKTTWHKRLTQALVTRRG